MAENFLDCSNADMQVEILDSISCGVFAYTVPEHELITINDEAKNIIGCKYEYDSCDTIDVIVDFMRNKIHPDDKQKFIEVQKQLQNIGDVVRYSYKAIIGGEIKHIKSTVKYLRLATGQKYILCSLLDITEQVMLTNSLSRERKSYRNALANGSEFNFLFDVTEGVINEEFTTSKNYNLVKDMGMTVPASFDILLEKYVERYNIEFSNENMRKNFTCKGLLKQFEKGITNVVTEYYNPVSKLYLRTSCLMSKDDETGHIYGSVVANDITDMRIKEQQQKEALKASFDEMNTRIDAILNGISGGLKIADVNDDYRYEYISEGAAQLQGYTVDEFLEKFGTRVTNNIHPEDGEKALAAAEKQMQKKGFYAVKYRVPHKDGSIRWVIDRGKLIEDKSEGKHWYILMQDVTELEERNSQLSDVLSMQEEMADSFSGGFFAYTIPEHQKLIVNQEALRIFNIMGMDETQSYDKIMSCIDEEDVDEIREKIQGLKNVGDRISYVFHSTQQNGNKITVKVDTKMLRFTGGQKYVLSSMTDITEQELLEKRIDEERRQYRNALALGCEIMFTIDLEKDMIDKELETIDGGITFMNDLGVKTPISYDDLASVWFSGNRIYTQSKDIEKVKSRKCLIEACESGTSILEIEYYINKQKKYRRALVLLYKVNDKKFANFITYDITLSRKEEKQKKDIIASLGKIYSALYHLSLQDNVCTVFKQNSDMSEFVPEKGTLTDFINIYVNEFVELDFRYKLADFLNPEKMKIVLAESDYVTVEFRRKHLGWCRANLIVSGRDQNGNITSVVLAGNVVDEQKNIELKQQEALRTAYESANMANSAKTDFLANMSHDIRTPMNAIIGLTAIAGTHIDDKDCITDCLSKITVSSKHLLGIINDVLDMSKIESGKMDLQEDEFNLSELINNLLIMCRPEVSAKNHQLSVSIKNIEHEYIIGDSQRIQQVFMNIMSNAIKYTPTGGKIALTISEKSTNKTKVGCYEFIFEDNGIGMDEEFQKQIFEPFTRARNDTRINKIQGTGLGMPITKNIVQMMNGNIKVESKLNIGTRITITLFLKIRNNDEIISYDNFINLPVLVADDDETSCLYTCQLLEELGMKGEWVLTGNEAIEKVIENHKSNNDFFAVIIDWKMPEMDGVETTKKIRKAVGKDVPIIIISAYDWTDIELEARKAGANAFISKPLFKSRVVHLFNDLLCGEFQNQNPSELDAFSEENFDGKLALLVEDNELNAEIATEILDMAGLKVEWAKNGKEAVDRITAVSDGYYDIIFMDIQMPVMNGYEATRAIRSLSRDYAKSVPIIAMTANAFAEDVAMAKNAGMNEHIAKPLDFGQLLNAMKKWLK